MSVTIICDSCSMTQPLFGDEREEKDDEARRLQGDSEEFWDSGDLEAFFDSALTIRSVLRIIRDIYREVSVHFLFRSTNEKVKLFSF